MKKTESVIEQKERLEKELKAINIKAEKEFTQKHYPEFKKLEGKCFKTRNSYGNDRSWWLYRKVTEIKLSDVYDTRGNGPACHYTGFSFQTCTENKSSIEPEKYGYVHHLGTQITEREFNKAWSKMIVNINKLKKS
jgi:hypothetical protein